MSMIKVIPSGSWDFGMEPTSVIKVSRSGLRGADRLDFTIKRAAAKQFQDIFTKFALQLGDFPIHTIAIGSTEGYGANRNGDGFCEETCRKQAASFVGRPLKDYRDGEHNGARFYADHKNNHPPTSYGYVKAAFYNDEMRRIELFIIANATKEAAERNGGLVMPDDWRENLENGGLMAGSMACKVAYDVCSICGNKAPSRKEYCTKESCVGPDGTQGFGCKAGLTKLLKSGRQQFVENPGSMFFDWSKVVRPAERTAYGGMAEGFNKAAAAYDSTVLGGAWLAEHYGCYTPDFTFETPTSEYFRRQIKLAHQLADIEADVHSGNDPKDRVSCLAFSSAVQPSINFASELGSIGSTKFASCMKALAEAQVILSPRDFFTGASPEGVPTVYAALKTAFRKLAADPNLPNLLRHGYSIDLEARPTQAQRSFAKQAAESRSVCPCSLEKRAQLAAIRGRDNSQLCTKSASDLTAVDYDAAQRYALYQLSTLAAMPEIDKSPLTLRTVVLQNTGIA